MKKVYIDGNQCSKVVKSLNDYFKFQKEIANVEYPLNIKYGSNEYLIYMFYSCLLDYGMRSKIYHKNLIETYKKYPNIFNSNYVLNVREEELKNIIVKNIHPRYPNIALKKWIELSKTLVEYDNILEYLKSIDSFKELEQFIKNIKGYGQKTGGLLIRVICDAGICNFRDEVESIPIDRHDIEISYLTGVISEKDVSNKDITELSNTYVKIGKEQGINPSDIDKFLWEVGNSYCNKKECINCPLNNCCKEKKIKSIEGKNESNND